MTILHQFTEASRLNVQEKKVRRGLSVCEYNNAIGYSRTCYAQYLAIRKSVNQTHNELTTGAMEGTLWLPAQPR